MLGGLGVLTKPTVFECARAFAQQVMNALEPDRHESSRAHSHGMLVCMMQPASSMCMIRNVRHVGCGLMALCKLWISLTLPEASWQLCGHCDGVFA